MELKIIDQDFSVCKIKEFSPDLLKDAFVLSAGQTKSFHLYVLRNMCQKTHWNAMTAGGRFGSRGFLIFPS